MESIDFLLKKSQFLSYLGQAFLKPTTGHPYSVAFTNNDLVLDLSPIYNQFNYSGKVTCKDEKHGLILEMNYQNSLLDGPCSITVWNTTYISGTWKNGLPNGIFQENVMGLDIFRGNLVNGQRHGTCRIISDANQSTTMYYCNGQESNIEKKNYNGIPVTVEKKRNIITTLTEITTRDFHYRLLFSELTGQLKELDVIYNNGNYDCKAKFHGDTMTVYTDITNKIVYTGGYAYIPPFSIFLHGEGTLYHHGIKNYSGNFVYSRKQGKGTFYYKDGHVRYCGEWQNDLPHGEGTILSAISDKKINVKCEKGRFYYGFLSYSVENYCPDNSFMNFFTKKIDHIYEGLNQCLFSSEAVLPMLISRDIFTSPFIHTKQENIIRSNMEAASNYDRIVQYLNDRNIVDIRQCTYLDIDFKMKPISYSLFPSLRKLVIHVLDDDDDFILQYQPHLEELSFVCKSELRKNVKILHCPLLSVITIDNNAIINCQSFTIKDCNCLQEITIGTTNDSICLSQLKSFELCYLPALSKLAIAMNIFTSLEAFHLHHLPLLQSLIVSHITFPNLKEFSLDNLPMFTSLSATHISSPIFHKIESLTLNNLPLFTFEGLIFNADCLKTLTNIHCDNEKVLKPILLYVDTDIQPLVILSTPDEHTNWSCATSISINTTSQFPLENYLLPTICSIIKDITITHFDSSQVLQIESFQRLESIKIGENCFKHCESLVIKNLSNLKKFSIGKSSFANCNSVVLSNLEILSEFTIQPKCFTKSAGSLFISGLPKLQSLSFNHSFKCYNELDIKSVINLQSILIEDRCFNGEMDILQLQSLQSLQNCTIRDKCFKYCDIVSIASNQHLSSLSIMNDCFSTKDGTIIIEGNSELKSISLKDHVCCFYQLELDKLPLLSSLEFANNVFVNMPSFSLSKFDHLRKIIIGSNCFKNTQNFSLVNLKVLNYLSIEENCFMMKLQNSLFELQALPQLSILEIEGPHSCIGFSSIHIENINKNLKCKITTTCFKNITSYRGNRNDEIVAAIINHSLWIENPCIISYNDSLYTKLQSSVTELTISNNACQNTTDCTFENYSRLRSITIGSNCFKKCSGFTISSLRVLHSVNIGKSSFTSMEVQQDVLIKNCQELECFCMDTSSCPNASRFYISNLPSLSLLHLPSNSFNKASEFLVNNCSSLFTLEIPAKSFQVVFIISIQDLPSLERIRMGVDSCQGTQGMTITIANCKELLSFEFDGPASTTSCKQCVGLNISNTPKLQYPDTLLLQKNIMQSLEISNIKDTGSFSQVFTLRNLSLIKVPSIQSPNDLTILKTNIQAVSIAENCLNNASFEQLQIQDLPSLEAFEMKNNCCKFVKKFIITNCSSLLTVYIQSNCCSEYAGKLSIEACDKLMIISIGCSFKNYKDFFISKLDSLQALSISDCIEYTGNEDYFQYQERMIINNFPNLKIIVFGMNVMPDLNFLSLKNLPVLSTLVIGENALRMNSKKIFKREGSTIKYSNTILLDNVPKLSTINCLSVDRASFEFIGVVKVKKSALSKIESLSEDTLSNVSLFISDDRNESLYEELKEMSNLYIIKQPWKK